jgi:hypothetical protein
MVDVFAGLPDAVLCVRCGAPLAMSAPALACSRCGQGYPRVGRIPVLMPRPHDQITLWRQQLGLLLVQGESLRSGIEEELARSDLLPAGRTRLEALRAGGSVQLEDIVAAVGPALGGSLPPPPGSGLPRGVVEYSHCLYRDWGWPVGAFAENDHAFDVVRAAVGGEDLGRTLVVGAGGCRLAYDLHCRLGALETAVVDIDPFLFVVAEAVVRGQSVRLTEATANVHEAATVSKAWTLTAPGGPLDEATFHFFLANGLAPPFRDGTFDSVVTPWFIDQVPTDLPAFLATLRRQLKAGGRWINHGPLLYPAQAPLAHRFSREELFELAARAGFRMGRWSSDSAPHLVSPLSGRGKIEWILTFEAIAT